MLSRIGALVRAVATARAGKRWLQHTPKEMQVHVRRLAPDARFSAAHQAANLIDLQLSSLPIAADMA
uniref:Uncharacterized protein n=1 Tax=Spironucleus salmonicida TaxID=348837 RepID=V6LR76_9EUKA|eukprot:EST46748.1 Hypothetical protein SS50377_13206 [Spironucleus salmonicida]